MQKQNCWNKGFDELDFTGQSNSPCSNISWISSFLSTFALLHASNVMSSSSVWFIKIKKIDRKSYFRPLVKKFIIKENTLHYRDNKVIKKKPFLKFFQIEHFMELFRCWSSINKLNASRVAVIFFLNIRIKRKSILGKMYWLTHKHHCGLYFFILTIYFLPVLYS